MKKRIKAIIFDVGGVLSLGNNSRWKKGRICVQTEGIHADVAAKLGISIDQYLDAIDTNYSLAIEGKISNEKVLEILSKNLKTSKERLNQLYLNAYKKHFKQNKELFEKAVRLKKLGYKIGVLSDQWYVAEKALMPRKLYNKFNFVIVSCQVKVRKPNTRIYKIAIKKSNFNPSEILFIDNQIWNIKPAKKLGMKTILFKDNKSLFKNKQWSELFL
jgi:epoxide hydrolase-like predicted phosphatase